MTARSNNPSPVVPIPAATLLLLRDGEAGLELLMTVRHSGIAFGSGAMVFPGGKVDAEDAGGEWDSLAALPPGDLDRAFAIAALRETFEEAGILIARRRGTPALLTAERARRLVATHRSGTQRAREIGRASCRERVFGGV